MTSTYDAVVVGGGISGLVCAYALQRSGQNVLLLESGERLGGMMRSERRDGFLIEHGPQSFSATAQIRQLCTDLGIEGDEIQADPRAPRYILRKGQLVRVPLSPPATLISSLLSWRTKASLLKDALGRTRPSENDESIAQFVRRKFSAELLDRLVGPFVSGIYAGDPERLSLRSAFPSLYEAERSKGSVIRGMMAAKKQSGPSERAVLMSFCDGNQTLARALAEKLSPAIRRQTTISQIAGSKAGGFFVTLAEARTQLSARHLVLATPPDITASLLATLDGGFQRVLGGVEFAPVAVISLGYRRADVRDPLNGFGFLIPRSEGYRVLGTIFNSSLFAHRAPAEHALITSFMGGVTDPDAASLEAETLGAMAHAENSKILGMQAEPVFSHTHLYRHALPQYNVGHAGRLARLEAFRSRWPGLWFAGNYLRGPAVGACVEQALAVAAAIEASVHPNA